MSNSEVTKRKENLETTLKWVERMIEATKNHMPTCSCHTCIRKREIESRPEIKKLL